jgi:hypothetical protein
MFNLTKYEYLAMREEYAGFCTACGAEVCGIEPDARNCICDECDNNSVFGVEELLMMGEIEFIAE